MIKRKVPTDKASSIQNPKSKISIKVPLVVAKKMPSDESFIVREEFEKRYRYLEN